MTSKRRQFSAMIPSSTGGWWILLAVIFAACGSSEMKPVDIFPEDNCAYCRMTFSDQRFASEIVTDQQEVFKFDDIGCMLKFTSKRNDVKIAARYVKDYESKVWIPYEHAVIVDTDIDTPMGSGKAAFVDSAKAGEFQRKHPANRKTGAERDRTADHRQEAGS